MRLHVCSLVCAAILFILLDSPSVQLAAATTSAAKTATSTASAYRATTSLTKSAATFGTGSTSSVALTKVTNTIPAGHGSSSSCFSFVAVVTTLTACLLFKQLH